ncbi:MAG: FHA domain-containing protein [Anaerolineae bacterium]
MSDETPNIPRPGQQAPYLTLLIGRDKQQVLVRMREKGITIGRSTKKSRVDVDTSSYSGIEFGVSREHVLIAPKRDYFYVQDLDSVNSTWHNKVRMRPMVAEELYHGDLLHLGELRIEVFYTYEDEVRDALGATTQLGDVPSIAPPSANQEPGTVVFTEEQLDRASSSGDYTLPDDPD